MNREELGKLYKQYELTPDDVFKHKHYTIITRSGIEKIALIAGIDVNYKVIKCEKDFCVVKAYNEEMETFGSALYGGKVQNEAGKWVDTGTTTSWYVMEIAEKRALSRLILKSTGFYSAGAMGEDESEDFKKPNK